MRWRRRAPTPTPTPTSMRLGCADLLHSFSKATRARATNRVDVGSRSPRSDAHAGPISTHIDFLDFYDANRRARDRDLARSRDRDRGEGRKEEKRSHQKPRARARRGGADGEGTPRSPPSRAFDRHSTAPTRRVPGPRPNANERANDAERFVRTDHSYARARRRSHRAREGGHLDRPSLADASAAGPLG